MNSKIALPIMTTAIVAVIVAVYACPAGDDQGLSVLSDDDINAGLEFKITTESYQGTCVRTVDVLNIIEEEVVEYSDEYEYHYKIIYGYDDFDPDKFFFDYTSANIPDGIAVQKDGSTYIISGQIGKVSGNPVDYRIYNDLKITLDSNGRCTNVSGSVTIHHDEYDESEPDNVSKTLDAVVQYGHEYGNFISYIDGRSYQMSMASKMCFYDELFDMLDLEGYRIVDHSNTVIDGLLLDIYELRPLDSTSSLEFNGTVKVWDMHVVGAEGYYHMARFTYKVEIRD